MLIEHIAKNYHKLKAADREACGDTISRMEDLAMRARWDAGIPALKDEVKAEMDAFMKEAVEVTCKHHDDKALLEKLLVEIILAKGSTGTALLKQFIIAEGLLMISEGTKDNAVGKRLTAMLGAEYYRKKRTISRYGWDIPYETIGQHYMVASVCIADARFAMFKAILDRLPGSDGTKLLAVKFKEGGVSKASIDYTVKLLRFDAIRKIIKNLPGSKQAQCFECIIHPYYSDYESAMNDIYSALDINKTKGSVIYVAI